MVLYILIPPEWYYLVNCSSRGGCISIYNTTDLRKLTINFHEWDKFCNFHECEARVKIMRIYAHEWKLITLIFENQWYYGLIPGVGVGNQCFSMLMLTEEAIRELQLWLPWSLSESLETWRKFSPINFHRNYVTFNLESTFGGPQKGVLLGIEE